MPMPDMISTLPDDVLGCILSFLPTQNAVATSILSKRWKWLWLSVPSVYFDAKRYLTYKNKNLFHRFLKFIYANISTRDNVARYHLQGGDAIFDLSYSDLNMWVYAATQRGLENLQLENLELYEPLFTEPAPRCIFSCKTLVVLKLKGLDVDVFSSVDLPSLKTLHLNNVRFVELHYLVELFSGCPILEDMNVRDTHVVMYMDHSYDKVKSLSKLIRADIYDIGSYIPLQAICNVAFLRIDQYVDDIPVFPNLTHVELIWSFDMNWDLVLVMFKQCPKLQIFGLDMGSVYTHLGDVVWHAPHFVPESLSSQLRKCSIKNFDGMESELCFAKYVLQSSRVLRMMAIHTPSWLKLKKKLELLKELCLFPRNSAMCGLLFK